VDDGVVTMRRIKTLLLNVLAFAMLGWLQVRSYFMKEDE
jgi:hypothetical protein